MSTKRRKKLTPKQQYLKRYPFSYCRKIYGSTRGYRYGVFRVPGSVFKAVAKAACAQEAWKRAAKRLRKV